MVVMAAVDRQALILDSIDSLRKRKARPDLERICHMVERKYGLCGTDVISELDRMVDAEIVIKVDYKGHTSYRNAAKWCKSRLSGYQLNSDDATRTILAAIEKLTVKDSTVLTQEKDARESKETDGALQGTSLDEIEKFFMEEDPDTKFTRTYLEEAVKREVSAGRLLAFPDDQYILAKFATLNEDNNECKVKRGRPLKRKRIKKTHGPDFEQEPLVKTSTWDQRCDYCTLPASCNKFGDREELLVCKDCGLKVHPSCMKYSKQLAERSRLSPWQCIDCKTCHVCDDAGDADTLLFCDSCDKGYHMVCHNPRIDTKPVGKWVCELCASEDMEVASNCTDDDGSLASSGVSNVSLKEDKEELLPNTKPTSSSDQDSPDVAIPNQSMTANLPEQSAQSQTSGCPKTSLSTHPSLWSLEDVAKYFEENGYAEQALCFKDQEIDGSALLLLRRSDVLTGLSFKLGPALKIYKHVSDLQLYHSKASPACGSSKVLPSPPASTVASVPQPATAPPPEKPSPPPQVTAISAAIQSQPSAVCPPTKTTPTPTTIPPSKASPSNRLSTPTKTPPSSLSPSPTKS